jgi:uncharacterized MAPEG superfamily protein
MNSLNLALIIFPLVTLLLVITIINLRGLQIFFKGRQVNSFTADGSDLSPMAQRLSRAHANCVENLPIFLAIVFASHLLEKNSLLLPLAGYFITARLIQVIVHICSTSQIAVWLRFLSYLAQIVIQVYWVVILF